jgi:hypothetical protein
LNTLWKWPLPIHQARRWPVAFLFAVLISVGCKQQSAIAPPTPTAAITNPEAADLTLALASLRKLAEGNDSQPGQRTIFYLNQWISSDPKTNERWQQDRMLESLPRSLRNTPGLERIAKTQFNFDDIDYLQAVQWLDDISYLQQNLWLHDIAERVVREPADAKLQSWLKEIEASVGLPEAEQLAKAERLLDWTTRNIQLDPLPPIPKDPLATAGSTETVMPSARGEVGPGYAHLPLEILLYGHGDAHERARVFILLCRQVGIDVAMLGFPEEQSTVRRGWLPAALVGGKLYLFDTALGMPIPGPNGKGIATLDQVTNQPEILRQLDLPGIAYPITEKDLKLGPVAMIDAEPSALAWRMQLLQEAMPQARKLALATQPSQFEPKLRKANVSGVSLWSAPFEAVLFRFGQQQLASQNPQVAMALYKQNVLFLPARPLIKARNLHLQGRFENEDQKLGARALYLQSRPPDREIDAMSTNEFYRKSIGLEQSLSKDPAKRKASLDMFTDIAREGKFHATFWLGLTYYESGKYEAATEWLGERTVQVSPPSPWTPSARYNLARCYEKLGRMELAKQWLESDQDSPQRHGNLLRAKGLVAEKPSK